MGEPATEYRAPRMLLSTAKMVGDCHIRTEYPEPRREG